MLEMNWHVYAIVLCNLVVVLSLSACIPNPVITDLHILAPVNNALVAKTYYTKLSADIKLNVAEFNLHQHEYHICATATIGNGVDQAQVFHECGRSVFGQGAVQATEGWNDLTLAVYHNTTKLCQVNVTVACCADAASSREFEERKQQQRLADFHQAGKEIELRLSHQHQRNVYLDKLKDRNIIDIRIGIKSSALNLPKREAIRATWLKNIYDAMTANEQFRIQPYFLIGNSTLAHMDNSVLNVLRREKEVHGDVLLAEQLPVADRYTSLGEKVLGFLSWLHKSSQQPTDRDFVIICDDDVYVDVWQLKQYLSSLSASRPTGSFYGGEVKPHFMRTIVICSAYI